MQRRRPILNVIMGVADIGDFSAILPIVEGKRHARFNRADSPSLMGSHLYVEQVNGLSICALRTNNGTLDVNKDGTYFWQGIVRYTSYKLVAPVGQVIMMEDGTVGTEIVLYDGEPIEFLPRATFEHRFVVCPAALADQASAYLQYADVDGAWQPLAANYGPSELPLPSIEGHNYEAASAAEYQAWLNAWETGTPLGTWECGAPRVGPRQPAGEVQPYAHGGNGIDPNHGYEQSRSNTLLRRWKHSRWMDRMNAAIFDTAGTQVSVHSFSSPQHIQQIRGDSPWQWENDLPVFLTSDWDTANYVVFNGGPAVRREEVWQHKSVWVSHYIRAIQNGIAVWEYTHDPMIADDLIMLFEHARFLQFSDRDDEPEHLPDYTPPSIKAYKYGSAHDGNVNLDRAAGWAMYLGAQVHRMGKDNSKWLKAMISLINVSTTPYGTSGKTWHDEMPVNTAGVQTFHEMIIAIGYHAACTQMGARSWHKLRTLCFNLLDNPYLPAVEGEYDSQIKGPPHWVVTHVDNELTLYGIGGGDPAHVMQVLALTYLATRERRWLDVSLKHWVVADSLQQKLAWLQSTQDKSWGGTLQAVLEAFAQ